MRGYDKLDADYWRDREIRRLDLIRFEAEQWAVSRTARINRRREKAWRRWRMERTQYAWARLLGWDRAERAQCAWGWVIGWEICWNRELHEKGKDT